MTIDTRATRAFNWITQHPWTVLLLTLLVVAAAASGGRLLRFTTDYRVFFSEDNPQLLAFDALERTYTKNDNVMFLLAPRDGKTFTRKLLADVEWLTHESWQVPYSIRVDSITNFQHTRAEGDDLIVEDLVENSESMTDEEIAYARSVALAEPLLVHRLISPSAHVTAVNITIQLPGKDITAEVPHVVKYVRHLENELKTRNPDNDVYVTGMVMFNNGFAESAQGDMKTLVPLSLLVIIIGIGLLLRGWVGTFTTLWIILLSIATAMGLTGWLGMQLTPPSSAAPTIILTLAVADAVHLLVTFFHGYRHGMDKRSAMMESLRVNLQPVFLTSLTTVLGFLSMNFSDAPPFRDLGNIVAMGVIAAFFLSITLLPALVMLLPVKRPQQSTRSSSAMDSFANFVVSYRKPLLVVIGTIIITLTAFIPRNELNDVFVEYFAKSLPIRQANDFASANLSGLYMVHYALDSGESGGISEPDFLNELSAFSDWLRMQPEVVHVYTLSDIMKRLNMNMHGDDPAWQRLPDKRELAAQYLLLYEMSLPYGLDLNDQIDVDKAATRVVVTSQTLSVKDFLALEARVQQWLSHYAPHIHVEEGTGATMMFSHIGHRNIRSMLLGTSLALLLISAILIVALRSVKIGLISLIPNLAPAGMAFGIWGLTIGQVGLALSVVVGMTLGIVVDDTVHFLSKYMRARREKQMDAEQAVRYAFSTVGTALWVTTVVLIAGFSILAMSTFRLNSDMGLVTAITIALALVVDFLFLPPLLISLSGKLEKAPASAGIVPDVVPMMTEREK